MVGLFFYINSTSLSYHGFLCHTLDDDKAEVYGDMLTDPYGHSDLFDSTFADSGREYYDFPRGRVVYDTVKKEYVIYIDHCLNKTNKIISIKKLFCIEEKNCRIDFDDHYVCKRCSKTNAYQI